MTDEKKYPCEKCGTLRSENQGGKIFTVCENCWNDNGNDLKPCPFCGERAELIKEEPVLPNGAKDEMYYVKCTNRMCQIRTMSWYPKNSAIRTWNNRR